MSKPTQAQKNARTRNWGIKQMRAYYHLCPPPISETARKKIQKIIDQELTRYGAEPETVREKKRREEYDYLF